MSFTGYTDTVDPATIVKNVVFWPDLNLADFTEEYRLPAEYRESMIIDRLRLAMIWANRELVEWQTEKIEEGATALGDVDPGEMLGEINPLELLYRRAVCCRAKALLLSDYQTMMRKSDAQNDARESDEIADTWYSMANGAIADFLGKNRIRVSTL